MLNCSVQDLRSDFNSFLEAKQLRQEGARSAFFASCGRYYSAVSHQKIGLKSDRSFQKAKNLEDFFGHAPGAMDRLRPKQEDYLARWKALRTLLKDPSASESQIQKAVRKFVLAHRLFVAQTIKEVVETREDDSTSAEISSWPTLRLFYKVVFDALVQNPGQIAQVQELFATSDPRCFQSVPYQAMLRVLSQMQQEPLPQEVQDLKQCRLHNAIESAVEEWKQIYQNLEESDKSALARVQTLFSAECNLSGLSEAARELFDQITSKTYRYGIDSPVLFSSLSSSFCRFISEDINLAKDLAQSNQLQLQSLSPENYIKLRNGSDRFAFLPENQEGLTEKHTKKRCFYRIESILALAQSIQNQTII